MHARSSHGTNLMNPQLSEFRIYTMEDSDKTSYRIVCFPANTEGCHFIWDHHILLGIRGEAALRLGNPSSKAASRTSSSRLAKMNDSSFCMDKEDTCWCLHDTQCISNIFPIRV